MASNLVDAKGSKSGRFSKGWYISGIGSSGFVVVQWFVFLAEPKSDRGELP